MTPHTHSNFAHGFSGGLTVRGMPVLNAYSGNIVWVDSGGSTQGNGTFKRPYAALETATNNAAVGDTVIAKAGHAETITTATALNFDKAGISYLGLGHGGRRPTITWGAAAATIPVSAANITMTNFLLKANFADVASAFTLTTAQDLTLQGCEFRDTTSALNFLALVTTTVAVVADGLAFIGNTVILKGTTAATTPIKIAGTHDRVTINDNLFNEAILNNTSAVLAHGALVVTNLEMARNKVVRPNTDTATGGILITTSSTTNTGIVYDNYIACADVAGIILVTAGSIYGMANNLVIGDADASAFVLPAIGAN